MVTAPEEGDEVMLAAINTTPLVDVMLVLLIIFLVTIPVVIQAPPVALPSQEARPAPMDKVDVTITIDGGGRMFWNDRPLADAQTLDGMLRELTARIPSPGIHIRGDKSVRFAAIGKVAALCRRAGIDRLGFVTRPGEE